MMAVTANGDTHHRRRMGRAEVSVLVTKTYDRGDVERALKVGVGGCRGHYRWWGCPGELCLGWKGVLSQGRTMTSLGSTQR